MNLINFIVWLSVGAFVGWFARRMVEVEHKRSNQPLPIKVSSYSES